MCRVLMKLDLLKMNSSQKLMMVCLATVPFFIVMILPKVPSSVRLCRHSEFSGNAPYGEGLGWGKQ